MFSAKSKQSLEQYQEKFSYYFENRTLKSQQFSNIAFTLKNGREDFAYRKFALGNNMISMTDMLKKQPYMKINSDIQFNMVWMFSGHRTQYHHMAMDLFNKIPRFKNSVLRGIEIANSYLNCDLLSLISDMENPAIHQIQYAEPALFIIEYALACLLLDCGIKPNILIGHGLGEYVAACIAGIFSFEDAIALVCERGLLIANTPKGEMLLVECSMEELSLYQSLANIDIAMHNTDENYVLSGTLKDINIVQSYLEKKQKPFQKLNTNHAFHSYLIESIELPFKAMFHNIKLSPPEMPIISNVTGTWMSAKEATDPEYWYQHLRQTIQFSQGINLLLTNKHPIFLEIGLGDVLSRFIKSKQRHQTLVIHTLPNRQEQISDLSQLLYSLGTIWSNGLLVNLKPLFDENDRQYIAIPTYTFQRKKYWIEPDKQQDNKSTIPVKMSQNEAHPISHSQIQQDLNMLFGKSLGVKNVGIDDDYFDLGGHSLTALKLIDEINKRYNAKLTIQTFYTSSTISKITQLLSNNINSKPIPIIFPFRINKESDKNIFICHPISGVVTGLKDLANALPDTYSVYGLQDPSISKGSLLYHDIKSIASAYLSEIVKFRKPLTTS